jgi:hypothetical protein
VRRNGPKLLILLAVTAVTAFAAPAVLAQSESPPERLELEVFIGNIALADGEFEVRGALECSQPSFATVTVEVTDEVARQRVAGGNGDVNCLTEPANWEVAAPRDDGLPISEGSFDVKVTARALDRPYSDYTGVDRYAVAEGSAGLDQSLDEAPAGLAEDGDAEAAASAQSAVAADGLTGFVARDPALSLLLWFASLVAVVLASAWATLRLIGRRAGPGSSEHA